MEKKVSEKFTILKLSLLITFLITMIVTTVIMGNRNEVDAATAYDDNGILWRFSYDASQMEIYNLYTTSLTVEQAENLVIPSIINFNGYDYTVRSVGYGSSSNGYMFPKTIKNLTIPDTVTSINSYAFYSQTQLQHVTMGAGITSIGNNAFYNCYNMTGDIVFGENLTYIGNSAFSNCNKLEGNITLYEGLTTIGSSAFSYCYKLGGDLVLPKSLTTVGNYAFNNCRSIKSVKFGDNIPLSVITGLRESNGLERIELYDDSELYKVEDGILFSKDGKRLYFCEKRDYNNYVVPSDVTSIEANAFRYANSMTGTLTLNEGLLSIGNSAFYDQKELTGNLRIPDSVTTLGNYAFNGCKNFDRVTIGSGITSVGSGTFSGLTDLFVNNVIGSVAFNNNYCDTKPVVHFLNSVKHVLVSKVPGVKLVNIATGTEIETGDYLDETTFQYRIEVEDGYNYDNLQLVWFDDNKYENYTNETVVAGQSYEFTPLLRERSIFIQNLNNGVDLSLRTFITEVNRSPVSKSRIPVAVTNESFGYQHTKEPVKVRKGDLVTYKVRIYNEALQAARATEITVHIPEGMTFDAENTTNKNYGWIQDGSTIKTSQLAFDDILSYLGNGVINYKDVEICLTVTEDSLESEVYKTVFAEITGMSGTDTDSTPGNVTVAQNYRIDEITNSNTTSFIFDQEDDDDFDTVVLNSKIRVEYSIRIEKVDQATDELLAGAKFELLSSGVNELVENGEIKRYEDEEVIARVTSDENGIVDFGGIVTYGAGENIYWIQETDAPAGYLTNIGKKMKVKVVKTILDEETGIYSVAVYCESSDYKVDTTHFEFTPVSTAEQLAKIGSGEIVNVDGVDYEYNSTTNYKLTNDIDLAGINWEPINRDLVGIIDGDGHKISNLTIVAPEEGSSIAKVGLISEFTGIIENLILENPNIRINKFAAGALENTDYYGVGGFVGYMKNGYFYNCKTTVTEGATAGISSGMDNVGGFVGHTAPGGLVTIINSENNVDISGTEPVEEEGVTTVEGTNNAGGLIGCSLGSISIQESKNTGKINCGKYGAGGLVGFVRPSDYEELAITAGYDEDNKRIDLLVENEASEGQYNVTLEIRDRKTDRLIGGAIYEVDKIEDTIKTALVDTGSLKLFDKAIEYTGRDVYFMTEEETVPGYDLLNGIIRVDIDRYWDIENNEYRVRAEASIITHKEYEEFVGERSTKEDDTKTGKTFERGDIFTEANVAKANWNGSKIELVNCTNDGKVTASKSNAAGMIGTSYGVVNASGCINNGEINGLLKSGGLVAELRGVDTYMYNGEISSQNTLDYSKLVDCTNNGKITSANQGWAPGEAGGLVAEFAGSIKVINGTNNGEIETEQSHTGGIVGKALGQVTIENSTNNGTITVTGGSTTDAGGILGVVSLDEYSIQLIKYKDVNAIIKNCKNNANLYNNAAHDIAGIVGLAVGNSITITDCEVVGRSADDKIKIYSYGQGETAGIMAWASCKTVTIKDCKIKNLEVGIIADHDVGTYGNVAGIFAINDAGYIPAQNSYSESKRIATNISNCIVEDCNILGKSKEVAGIMGITNGSYGYIEDTYSANINDCNVKNSYIEMRCESNGSAGSGCACAGIYAGGFECKGFNIRYCNVEDSRLEAKGISEDGYTPQGQYSTVGGIFGRGMYTKKCSIEGCNFVNSTIYNRDSIGTAGSIGGIYGTTYGLYGDLDIINCNVKNCDMTDYNSNAGGLIGQIDYGYSYPTTTTIENCNVIETNITMAGEEVTPNPPNNYCVGGIIGSLQAMDKVRINNVKVLGKDIDRNATNAQERNHIVSKNGNIGGAIGLQLNNYDVEMNNVTIKNYDVVNNVSENKLNIDMTQLGGVIGAAQSDRDLKYKDITVENVNVKGNKTHNTAGFMGYLSNYTSVSSVDNVDIKNTSISSQFSFEDHGELNNDGTIPGEYYGAVAGLVGTSLSEVEFKNCDVENCEISYKKHIAAGGIAYTTNGLKATSCTVKNVEFNDNWEEPENIEEVANLFKTTKTSYRDIIKHRNYGGFIGTAWEDTLELENIKVSNVDIEAKYASIGGIYAYADNIKKLNNCIVEDSNFVSKKSIRGIFGSTAGIGAETIAMNCEPTNNKVSNVQITTDNHINSGMFGYINNGINDSIKIGKSTVENVTLTNENKALLANIDHREDDETALIEYNPVMAGIVGLTAGDITINNATVKNATITAKAGDTGMYTHIGGIIALTGHNINIDNAKVINTNINNNTGGGITGGLVGMNRWITPDPPGLESVTTITNSSIEQNSSITANNNFGGMVGYAKVQMDKNKVLDTTIKANSYTSALGGVVGLVSSGGNSISNTTITNLSIPDGEYTGANVGGITAVLNGGTITNTTITNAEIVASSCAAGIAPIQYMQTDEIRNATITNATITSKGSHAAGATTVAFGIVSNIKVIGSTITGNQMVGGVVGVHFNPINQVEIDGTTIVSTAQHAGGVAAVALRPLTNIKVKDSNVTGLLQVGGVAGIGNEMTNIEVDNVKVTSTTAHAGGLGSCILSAVTTAKVKDSTITAKQMAGGVGAFIGGATTDIEVSNTSVTGTDDAGGVAGVLSGALTDVEVKDSTIKAKRLAGGIAGTTEWEIKDATVDGSTIISEELHAGGIVACTKNKLNNCTTKNSTIKTLTGTFTSAGDVFPTCLGGLVGAGYKDTSTNELKPQIVNSTVENNTLTGATGSSAGKYVGAPAELNDSLIAAETTQP